MNQILYTDDKKNKNNKGPLEIKTILIVFAILCIGFGIILAGKAIYSIISKGEENNTNIPLVEITQEGKNLILNIKHDKIIDKIVYDWNSNGENTLYGRGRMEIEEKIEVPFGINKLNLKVIDADGQTVTYNKEYELTNSDVTNPTIELPVENAKVKILAKDETELDYIEYHWNNEDSTKIEVRENSLKLIEEKIPILKGENTLTVIAVDKAGNKTVKEQTFKGVKKPFAEITRNGNEVIVKVQDEEGIKRIDYTFNGVTYSTDSARTGASLDIKETEFKIQLVQGENKITVKVVNIDEIETEVSTEINI